MDLKDNPSWAIRELEYGWTDCAYDGGSACTGNGVNILTGEGCSYWWEDSPTALFYDDDNRRNDPFVRSFYKWVDEDASNNVKTFCELGDIVNTNLLTDRPHWLRYRTDSAAAPNTPEGFGCTSFDACTFDIDVGCFIRTRSGNDEVFTSNQIFPVNSLALSDVTPQPSERITIGDGCVADQFRQTFERRVTVTKTGYDEAYKRQCCMGEIPNEDVRCDPAWRVDDPEAQCNSFFIDQCFVQQDEPCGRALMFNDEPWDPAAVTTKSYCGRYMDRMRAIMGGLQGALSPGDRAKIDAFQTAMLEYCQGAGFGYGECACVNGVLPCHNPFQPVSSNDPQTSGQECVMMDHPRPGGASRRYQLTRSEFTESKAGDPIRNAGGVDVQLLPTHCWAPACNRSGRCMFRDYLSDREPCPSVCAQYVDQENISVKRVEGRGVYIGNHVLTCNLGNSQDAALFATDPVNIDAADITAATASDVQSGSVTVTFRDADQSHSSTQLDPAATFISSVAEDYVPDRRAPALQDVAPTLGSFRVLSTLSSVVTVHPDDVEQHVSPASPTATVRYSIDNSKIQPPAIDTHFMIDLVLRDVTGANPDVLIPINLLYRV